MIHWLLLSVAVAVAQRCVLPIDPIQNPDGHAYLVENQVKYIYGDPQDEGAIYQTCVDGVLTCYEENGFADSDEDDVVDCRKENAKRRLGLATDRKWRLWPHATLCYKFAYSFDHTEQSLIHEAMNDIVTQTGVQMLDIDECKQSSNAKEICGHCRHYVAIDREKNKHGTYAELGYRHRAGQKLNLLKTAFDDGKGTIIHEMLHSFGVIHEHVHPASEAIVIRSRHMGASMSNYIPIKEAFVTMYDKVSIMHYKNGVCLPKNRSIKYCTIDQNESDGCIIPTEDDCDDEASKVLGQRKEMSNGDIRNLQLLYGMDTTVTRKEVIVQQTHHPRVHKHPL
ncbi:metalloprotease family M12A [Thraustotheca clavata]|uniref:Metalloendopeptidase n=1 Tax=Thraustotheca clavata TaxID=74557 RepID=A0A0A7CLY7_9STRA|nr:secreted protein [Thraustotheca clavata]OQS05034.1 metalloprotease family M12A [Thraustotheca clavata]